MTADTLLKTRCASTENIPPEHRLEFWDDYNASILVGLRSSTYSKTGFVATQDNLHFERLGLARINGNEHVVERDCSLIRSVPKESIFVSLILGCESFFYQGKNCKLLKPGELMIYRTDKPYLFGFSGSMHQLTFDMTMEDFSEHCRYNFKEPLKVGSDNPAQRLLVRTLAERTEQFLDVPRDDRAGRYQEDVYDLLAGIVSDHSGAHRPSALTTSYLLVAKQYIQDHLSDPLLNCEQVAGATGVSSRHLARLFSLEKLSLGQFIQKKRLERARQLLMSPRGQRLDVSEIAYSHGFSSQSHFARTFKKRYGITPSDTRALLNKENTAQQPPTVVRWPSNSTSQ